MRAMLIIGLVAAALATSQLGSAGVTGTSPTIAVVSRCLAYTPAVPRVLSSRELLVLVSNNAATVQYSVFLFFGRTAAQASVLREIFLLRGATITKLAGPESWRGEVGTISFVGFGPKALAYAHPSRAVRSAVTAETRKLVRRCI